MFRRQIFAALLVLAGLSALASVSAPATAQQPGQQPAQATGLQIAILDLEAIRRNSVAIKDIRAQIAQYRKGYQEDIKKEEDALRSANKELAKKRTLLGPEAFAKERRLFEQKVVGVQKLVRQRKVDLDQALAKAMLVVEKKMNEILADLATKRGASLVIQRQHTILADRAMDMTGEVLQRLNAELKTVKVAKPGSK